MLAAIWICHCIARNRGRVQILLKRSRLTRIVSENLGCLRRLACGKLSHRELVFESLDALIFLVNLVLTQPVDDALSACRLGGDDVTDAIGEGCTVGAVLGEDGGGLLGVAELDVGRELCGLHVHAVEALHHAHVRGVKALVDGVLRGTEAVAERHLHVAAAVAELRGKALDARVDALERGLNHLVAEAAVDVLGVVEPRVKLVAADATSAVAAAVATVAVEATKQDEQQQNPNVLP